MSFKFAALFFFLGIICNIFFRYILQYYKITKLFSLMNYHILSLLQYIETIYTNTFKFSRKHMEKSQNFTKEEMQITIETDESELEMFKITSIDMFYKTYPSYLHKMIPFKNWDEAMLWVRRYEKEMKK